MPAEKKARRLEVRLLRFIRSAVILIMTAASSMAAAQQRGQPEAQVALELEKLAKAAQAERAITWYMSSGEAIARRVGDAFNAKYGINVSFLRLGGPQLMQRFATEAESGKFGADILVTTFAPDAIERMTERGWVETLSDRIIPVLRNDYPAELNQGSTRLLGTSPWQIGYNTNTVKKGELKEWKDVLDVRWKGRLLIPEPSGGDSYLPFWNMMLQRYGEGFFRSLREQNPRFYNSGIPAIQGLAAGEGDLVFPVFLPTVLPLKISGAPIDVEMPKGANTGNFTEVLLAKLDRAPHPNAARLFANFLLSREGNAIFNADPGQVGSYQLKSLPAGFQLPDYKQAMQERARIFRLIREK